MSSSFSDPVSSLQPLVVAVLRRALPEHPWPTPRFEHPAQAQFGDYSTNIAMATFAGLNQEFRQEHQLKSPRQWAEWLVTQLEIARQSEPSFSQVVAAISVAGPGFINFSLTEDFLLEESLQLAAAEYQISPDLAATSKKIIIEYMQPNTNKPLHVGHLRNAVLGNALINAHKAIGWDVKAATINNDRGLHITKSMWGYLVMGKQPLTAEANTEPWQQQLAAWQTQPDAWIKPERMTEERLQKPDHFVGYWYVQADRFAEDPQVQKTWQEMLIAWEQASDPQHQAVRRLWQRLNDWFYEGYQQSAARLGFWFDPDQISYESAIYEAGRQIIVDGAERGIFERLPDGAVRANLGQFKLPDKILLRRDGTGIYMTFDIELTRQRVQQHADKMVWVVGSDQNLYFQQLFAVSELLGYGKRQNFQHFGYGMVRLPEGKMSSRKGTVVYADDVMDSAVARALQIMSEAGVAVELSDAERHQVAEAVGMGAVKWTMLAQDPMTDLTFDLDTSVSFRGFAGPYVQYAYARASSVIEKAIAKYSDTLLSTKVGKDSKNQEKIGLESLKSEEKALMRQLYQLPEVLNQVAAESAPHLLAIYLHQTAQAFNTFYAQCPIAHDDVPVAVRRRRLELTQAVRHVLRAGLLILGIPVVEKM